MAQQIKSFGMSAMTIGSCSDFHTQVNKLITAATPAALHVAEKATAYSDSQHGTPCVYRQPPAVVHRHRLACRNRPHARQCRRSHQQRNQRLPHFAGGGET